MNWRSGFLAGLLLAGPLAAGATGPAPAPAQTGVIEDAAGLHRFAAEESARPRAPRLPRAAFLAKPALLGARLSPDGRRVAALVEHAGARGVRVADAAHPQGTPLLQRTTARDIAWSRDGRWLFLVLPDQVSALSMAGQSGSGAIAMIGGRSHLEFAGADPWLPAAVILLERPPRSAPQPRHWGLWRARAGAPPERLYDGTLPIVGFAFAPGGRLDSLVLAVAGGHSVVRRNAGGGWRRVMRCAHLHHCRLVGTVDGGRSLLVITDVTSDRQELVLVEPDDSLHVLHADPRGVADIDEVVVDPDDGHPRMVAYRSDSARNYAVERGDAAALSRAEALFPDGNIRIEVGGGAGAAWLLHERGTSMRGERLYTFDPATADTTELLPQLAEENRGRPMPRLQQPATARQRAVAWRASDGMRLHGWLTLPRGVDAAHAPLMVVVHGGPWGFAGPDWNGQAQFLANRGYAVFQPNFRGSTGFGRRYLLAAGSDFGGEGRVQRDIVEGTRWLLANGVGDPQRVGIAGASFGGYATLLGVTFQPGLYKVGTAAVPPGDFGRVVREYTGSSAEFVPGVPLATSAADLGIDPADAAIAERLRAQSPIAHAADMHRPLLLFAGDEDDRVPIEGVTHYAALLHMLHGDVSLFVDPDAGHHMSDPRTAEAWLYLQEALLQRVFGGPAPEPPSMALQEHVERDLRLRGRSLADRR